MRTGAFHESLESLDKAFELLAVSKEEFGGDLHIVQSKFYMLKSNVHFILGNWKESVEASELGLASIDQVTSMEPDIIRAMKNTTRDLYNNRVRGLSKITGKPVT